MKFLKETLKEIGYEETYDLEIDDKNHNFLIEGGIVTSNSHAISYSLTTFITAYLSTYYPIEWYTALLNHEELVEFLPIVKSQIAKRKLDIKIVSPKLDECFEKATCVKEKNEIVIGVLQLKGITDNAAKELSELALKNIKFKTFEDFLSSNAYDKKKLNKTVVERLIDIGFFDNLDNDRLKLRIIYDDFRNGKLASKKKASMNDFLGVKAEGILNLEKRKAVFLAENENFYDKEELYFVKREVDLIGLMVGFNLHPFSSQDYEKYRNRIKHEKGDERLLFVNNIEEIKVKTKNYRDSIFSYYLLTLKSHNGKSIQISVSSKVMEVFGKGQFQYDIMNIADRKKSMIVSYSEKSKSTEATKIKLLYLQK